MGDRVAEDRSFAARPSALALCRAGLAGIVPVVLVLAGCTTTTPQDAAALIPANIQASVIAEEHMRQAREAANTGDPNAKPVSVQDMLARARAAEASAPPGGSGAAGAPTAETPAAGSAPGSAAPRPAAAPATAAKPAASAREFEITFQGAEDAPGTAETSAFAKAWKAAKVPAKAQVMITAGPSNEGTAFDQALLANRRLRAVRSLLPAETDAKQLYDPDMIPDTVRVVVAGTD